MAAASKKQSAFQPVSVSKTFNSREEAYAFIEEFEEQINDQEDGFTGATITFETESELHDVLAALGAYHDKKARVVDSGTAPKFGLYAYTGNARATVRRVLPGILESLGIEADTTPLS
jgi:hypothetical protein